jgi:hypothetical protein
VEFGIQPLLYRTPPALTAYPLSIAVPAMMIGHLTVGRSPNSSCRRAEVCHAPKFDPQLLQSHPV